MNPLPAPAHQREYRLPIILYHFVVTGMLLCLTYTGMHLALRIFPGWQSAFLLPVAFFVSLEGMLTTRMVRPFPVLSPDWFFHRVTEWIVLLVVLKALLYLLRDPAQLLTDVLLWDEQFLASFFTPEYLVVVLVSLFLWTLATQFANHLLDLEESVEELELESQGVVIKDRQALRRVLVVMVFGLGLVLLIMLAFLHADIHLFAPPQTSLRASVMVLLLYFLLGFVLLAQSQYFIQRARWYLQQVDASPGIGSRWALYSFLLLSLIAGLVSLLPTGYSASAFLFLQRAVGILLSLIAYLMLLIATPFLYLFQLLARTFPPGQTAPPPTLPVVPAPPVSQDQDMIWMLLKSLLFWTVFFSVIVFSFKYYINRRREAWEQFKHKRGVAWFFRLLAWLHKRLRRLNRGVAALVEDGAERIRSLPRPRWLPGTALEVVGMRLPARIQVLLVYTEMLAWTERNGVGRKRHQTPREYAGHLTGVVPGCEREVESITAGFMEARYTRHEIGKQDAERVRADWKRLKHDLRLQLNQKPPD